MNAALHNEMETCPLTAVVMTFNEEANIERCLRSVAGWADQIVVVDGQSTDRTLELAGLYTDEIFIHPFEDHVRQWTWALENADPRNDWLLALDADFEVTRELREGIQNAITSPNGDRISGYYLNRLHIFRGRAIRHGGAYPARQLRLFRRDAVYLDQADRADQHFYVRGRTGKLKGDIIENNRNQQSLSYWVDKQIRFAAQHAEEELAQRSGTRVLAAKPSPFGDRNRRVLWLKVVWSHLPLYWRSVFYFHYRYFFRLGFLDGRAGFLYHFCQSLVYRVALDARIEELKASDASQDRP